MKPNISKKSTVIRRAGRMFLGVALLFSGFASASTWTGNYDNNWGDSRNWSGGVPGAGDTAIINSGGPNAGGSLSVAALIIGGGTVYVGTANVEVLNLSGGSLAAASTTIRSAGTWTGGTLQGQITIPTGVTVSIPSGSVRLDTSAVLTNSGTVTMSGGQINGYNSSVIDNHGTWVLSGNTTPFTDFYGGNVFNNHGLLRNSGGNDPINLSNSWTFNLNGETRCEAGELRFATTVNLPADALLSGAGTIRLTAGTTNLSGVISESSASLVLDGATLNCTETAAITGTLDWASGYITGTLAVPSGSTLDVKTDGFKRLVTSAILNISGTYRWEGPASVQGYNSCQVNILSGAACDLAADGTPFSHFNGGNVLTNHGLLRKSAGVGTTVLNNSWTYHQYGVIQCDTGAIECQSDLRLHDGSSLTGNGEVRLNGGVSMDGNVTETINQFRMIGNNLTCNDPCQLTGRLDWEAGTINGTLGIPSGSTLDVKTDGFKRLNTSAILNIGGTYRWTGPAAVEGYNSCRINILKGGTCDLAADGTPFSQFNGNNELINEGTLVKSAGAGGSTLCDTWTYRLRGETRCETSTFEFANTLVFEDSSTVTGTGDVIMHATCHLPGTVEFTAPSYWTSGTWTGSGGSITGLLVWSGGSSEGSWKVDTGGTLRIVEGTGILKRINTSAVIECAGTVEMASGSLNGYNSSTIRILANGVFSATGIAAMDEFYGGNILEIQPGGNLATSTGADLRVDWMIDNGGTVSTPVGRLVCNGGGTSTGLFQSTATGALHFTADTQTLEAGAKIRGPGEVKITGGTLNATAAVECFVHVAGGTVQGTGETGDFRFTDGSSWTSGYFNGQTRVSDGATLSVYGDSGDLRRMQTSARIDVDGTLKWQGPGPIQGYNSNTIEISPGGVLELSGDGYAFAQFNGGHQLINHGTILRSTSSGVATVQYFTTTSDGEIAVTSGSLKFLTGLGLADGSVISGEGRTVIGGGRTSVVGTTTVTGSTFELAGAELYSLPTDNGTLSGGTIEWSSGTISGTITWNATATTTGDGFRQLNTGAELNNAGTLTLANSGSIRSYNGCVLRNLPGAVLHATGQVGLTEFYGGNQLINEGTMVLGASPGRMIISYPFVQTATGRLEVGITGSNPATPEFDILQINSSASLAGTLVADLEDGYDPPVGASFEILTSTSRSGTFDNVVASRFEATYPFTGNPPRSLNNVVLIAKAATTGLDYATWASNNGLTGPDADPGADADADGTNNWLEYALNMNPKLADLPPVTDAIESHEGDDWLVLHYRRWTDRIDSGLVYQPQSSTNLSEWSGDGVVDETDPGAGALPGSEPRRCRVPRNANRNFLRLGFMMSDPG